MAFAQINYSQRLGTGPTVGSIAEYGCFLTSFSNLLQRFGESVDPPTLDNFFIQHGTFVVDAQGDRDNLSWGSVSAYDGRIVVIGTGGPGWPDTNDAIVEFRYRNSRGGTVTHFCLVADHNNQTIVDSWDGVTKHSPYGQPIAWAKYENQAPRPVVISPQPTPAEAAAFTVENIPETTKELKIDAHLWDLNRRTWPEMANNPVGTGNAGATFKTTQLAHHMLGGSYYLPEGSASQGYNVVDTEDPVAPPPAPAPAPAPKVYDTNTIDEVKFDAIPGDPVRYYVTRPAGAEKWNFKNVNTWRDFKSVQHVPFGTELFISGVAHHPIPPKGATYYMATDDFGDFKKTGKPANWYGFNWSDISETKPVTQTVPAPAPAPIPAPVAPTVTTEPVAATTSDNWQDSFGAFPSPVKYVATHDMTVDDLNTADKQPSISLVKGTVVTAYGTFRKDGVDYYRLRTNNDPSFTFWYSVPKMDPTTHTPNLLVRTVPQESTVSAATVVADTLALGKSRIATDTIEFLDDILPKWLRGDKSTAKK
jgi:hypothetical protein